MKRKIELPTPGPLAKSRSSIFVSTEDIFSPPGEVPRFRGNNESRSNKLQGTYVIYTINTLPDLILEARRASKKDFITLRFLLSPKFELLFAREGIPNTVIPPHCAMTGESRDEALCITAGNIKIDTEDNIIFISNKSGNFKPSVDSLQYALFALLACGARFSNTFTIEKHDKTIVKSEITLKNLQHELNSKFPDTLQEQYREINDKLVNQTHKYPKTSADMADSNLFFTNTPKPKSAMYRSGCVRKLEFTLDDDLEKNLSSMNEGPFNKLPGSTSLKSS